MKWNLEDIKSLRELLDLWMDTAGTPGRQHPLLHPDFLCAALAHFGNSRVSVLVGSDKGRLQLFLPVIRHRAGIWRTFSPSQMPIAPVFALNNECNLQGLIDTLPILGHTTLLLELLNLDGLYAPPLQVGTHAIEVKHYCDTICIDGELSNADYWSSRPKKLRNNIRRYYRRVESDNLNFSLACLRDPLEVDDALNTYCSIESIGWKGQAGTALSRRSTQGKFYSDVLRNFSLRRRARVFELRFDGVPVASRIAIESSSCVVFLKTTYLEEYAKYSPGRLLLRETISEYLAAGDHRQLEFCTNANSDMLQWGTSSRAVNHLNIYRNKTIRSLNALARRPFVRPSFRR